MKLIDLSQLSQNEAIISIINDIKQLLSNAKINGNNTCVYECGMDISFGTLIRLLKYNKILENIRYDEGPKYIAINCFHSSKKYSILPKDFYYFSIIFYLNI